MKVLVMPANQSIEVEKETTLLEAIRQMGIFIESPCGGNHTCGKCKVLVTKGNDRRVTKEEEMALTQEEIMRGMRLACSFTVNEEVTAFIRKESKNRTALTKQIKQEPAQLQEQLGVAIDIGTTTVEFHILSLKTKRLVGKQRFYNPQIAYGADVIARITYCLNHKDGQKMLHDCLLSKLNEEIEHCCNTLGVSVKQISRVVMVCNTTMSYIAQGTDVKELAKAPFVISNKGDCHYTGQDFGLTVCPEASIYMAPIIGGHVGSDAFACLVATKMDQLKGNYLLVDVGTNGEILLSVNGGLYACSTAAGPAFEGAGLSCGMRADSGAITKAVVKDGQIVVNVVDHLRAAGISGSGIIDVLAAMLKLQVMDDTGYIHKDICSEKGYLVAGNAYVTRNDVRQIQLAKGAIYAGIDCLLKQAGIRKQDLDGIYLAGAFGSNIDVRNAMILGLLPDVDIRKVDNVGNAAITGAKELLLNSSVREHYLEKRNEIQHIELADTPMFRECFINSLNFRSILF
ncbi:MAG: ASKHA domain-containing protein [bacterium]|nr:ASKHA domain-containing protein [bacterium]